MRDIYEAVEKMTIVLAMRVNNAVRKRGWSGKAQIDRMILPKPDGSVYPTRINLPLPLGGRVSFVPADAPSDDQSSWSIALRRHDGVVRRCFAGGLQVKKGEEEYQLFCGDALLTEALFTQILDEMSAGGLSGQPGAICRAYTARFGAASAEIYEILYAAKQYDQLERMHDAVLTGATQLEVEAALNRLSKWP